MMILSRREPRNSLETVYNLEVFRDHTFFASAAELLVHNCPGSPGQGKAAVNRGQAPEGIDRIDTDGMAPSGPPHVHFSDGSSMYLDGSARHGKPNPTNRQRKWLNKNAGFDIKK
jgi:hypothetical protein